MLREVSLRRFTQAERTAAVADLAPWIWNTTQELLPRTTRIADRFHVKEHLSNTGKAIYGPVPSQRSPGPSAATRNLTAVVFPTCCGPCAAMPTAVRRRGNDFSISTITATACVIRNSRRKGSAPPGVMEAGCKNLMGARVKRAGMHWTVTGANAIIALRCRILSGRLQDFWEGRGDLKKAA